MWKAEHIAWLEFLEFLSYSESPLITQWDTHSCPEGQRKRKTERGWVVSRWSHFIKTRRYRTKIKKRRDYGKNFQLRKTHSNLPHQCTIPKNNEENVNEKERGVKCFLARQFEDEILRRVMGIGEIPSLAPPHPTKPHVLLVSGFTRRKPSILNP